MLVYEGVSGAKSGSPRQIIKEAYRLYDFIREDTWLEMLSQRNDKFYLGVFPLADAPFLAAEAHAYLE